MLNKRQMLDAFAKFPGSYEFRYEDVQFRNSRDSVMLCFRFVYYDSSALDEEPIQCIETDTFARRKGRWLLVGVRYGCSISRDARSFSAARAPG